MLKRVLLGLVVVFLGPVASRAQDSTKYVPRQELPHGAQIALVFFSDGGCIGNKNVELGLAVQRAKLLLSGRAREQGIGFAAIGAAMNWSLDEGLAYLQQGKSKWGPQPFGAWDELIVGGNWLNSAATNYIWRSPGGIAAVPQVIVLRRAVNPQSGGIGVGPDLVLLRVVSSDSIVKWVKAGAPVPVAARP